MLLSSTQTFLLARVQHCQPLSQSKFILKEYNETSIKRTPSREAHFACPNRRACSQASVRLKEFLKVAQCLLTIKFQRLRLWTKDIDLTHQGQFLTPDKQIRTNCS